MNPIAILLGTVLGNPVTSMASMVPLFHAMSTLLTAMASGQSLLTVLTANNGQLLGELTAAFGLMAAKDGHK